MKTLIERLVAAGSAYVAEDHVLFSVAAMKDYGQLSKRSLDEIQKQVLSIEKELSVWADLEGAECDPWSSKEPDHVHIVEFKVPYHCHDGISGTITGEVKTENSPPQLKLTLADD